MRRASHRDRGFTLLEAIVALVLVSSLGLALFGWINSNLFALNRVNEVNFESEATVNILEFMHKVNPMVAPRGQATLGNYRVTWEAKPVTLVVDPIDNYYQFALYATKVGVENARGEKWFEITIQQVGYKQVRFYVGES